MSVPALAALFHWSPVEARARIRKRGLVPRTPTSIAQRPTPPGTGHVEVDEEAVEVKAVCLGTTPAAAWSLSGTWSAAYGSTWDLWECNVPDELEVHVVPEMGTELWEVRVLGTIPRGRMWHVGSRVVAARSRWYHAP